MKGKADPSPTFPKVRPFRQRSPKFRRFNPSFLSYFNILLDDKR